MRQRWLCALLTLPTLARAGTSADLPSFQFTYGTGAFVTPIAIAANADSFVYVADEGTKVVDIFDYTGAHLGAFHVGAKPAGISAGPDETIWVTTSDSLDVRAFTRGGEPVRTLRCEHIDAPGHWEYPRAVACMDDGSVLVSCDWRDKILHFTSDGAFLGEFATSPGLGTNTGAFSSVPQLALFADGTMLCAVPYFGDVRRYDLGGVLRPGYAGPAGSPYGVAVDPATQRSWVTSSLGILQYSPAGELEGSIAPSSGQWEIPQAMTADRFGHLHVIIGGGVVARFGMNPVPVKRPSWGAVKTLFR